MSGWLPNSSRSHRIESSSENNILAKAIERGDRHVITTVLKSGKVHELVIGLFINRFEFGLVV
jgi:hypothetical protein